jgi:hypothetical protein
MRLQRSIARGGSALVAMTMPLLVDTAVARADEVRTHRVQFDHTFVTSTGERVSCTVLGESELRSFNTPGYFATAFTQTFDSDECAALVMVDATYTDIAGNTQRSGTSAVSNVTWFAEDVGTHLEVTHSLQYLRDCISGCVVTFTTSPK